MFNFIRNLFNWGTSEEPKPSKYELEAINIEPFIDKRNRSNHIDDVETHYDSYEEYKKSKEFQRSHVGDY